MPFTVTVNLSKSTDSVGASCGIQFELDADDADVFQRHVQKAYAACSQAVDAELVRRRTDGTTSAASNGRNGRGPSAKQLEYIRGLAGQIARLDAQRLEFLAHQIYAKPLAALTGSEAGGLIGTLKAIKCGRLDLDEALGVAGA